MHVPAKESQGGRVAAWLKSGVTTALESVECVHRSRLACSAVLGHVTCVGIACEGCVWFCVSVCVTLVGGGSVVGQWLVSGRGGARCGGGWVSCWAETCVSSVMRQGWVQWVGVQWAAAVVVWE